jgi:hypothetical protein
MRNIANLLALGLQDVGACEKSEPAEADTVIDAKSVMNER